MALFQMTDPAEPEAGSAERREQLVAALRELLRRELPAFLGAVDGARRRDEDVVACWRSFGQDPAVLGDCLAYAYLLGVRVVLEPEIFGGFRRGRGPRT